MTPTELVLAAFAAIFSDFDADAAQGLLAPDYIQHNPAVPSGAAPVLQIIPMLEESGLDATIHRVIAEDDLVALHVTYDNAQIFGGQTLVGFDIFRVEDGKVAEHWDNLQPLAGPNPSGRSMTDGPTEITDRDQTEANRALALGLVTDVLIGGQAEKAADYISTESYHQHNPQIADGLDGLGAALQALNKAGTPFAYDKVHMTIAEGNFVLTASEGWFGDQHTAFYDLFRIEDDKVAEHWDVIQAIPSEFAHDNGKF